MRIKFMAGEMAKLHNISKQTLLYYDRIGLFRPNETNDETSYRYYSLEQCEDLDVILCLKNLGMKLMEIKAYLKQDSIQERIRLLESQDSISLKKIEEINKTRNRLKSIITSIKNHVNICPFEMGIKRFEERYIISEPVEPPFDPYTLELAIKKVLKKTREGYETEIHELLIYVEISPSDKEIFKKAAMMVGKNYGESIPAGDYAYIFHKGSYQSLIDSRQKLINHIEKSNYREMGDFIEKMLLDSIAVSSETDYLIEIQIPVEKKPG